MTDLQKWLDGVSPYSNPKRDMAKVLAALRAVVELCDGSRRWAVNGLAVVSTEDVIRAIEKKVLCG